MKTIGIINIIYGGLGLLASAASILGVLIQYYIFKVIQQPIYNEDPQAAEFFNKMQDVYDIYYITIPLGLIISILFLISGIRLLKKVFNSFQLTIAASYTNILGYIINTVIVWLFFLEDIFAMIPGFNTTNFSYFYFAIAILGGIISCGYPIFLLFYVKKDRFMKYYEKTV